MVLPLTSYQNTMTATLIYTISLALVFFVKKANTLFKKKAKPTIAKRVSKHAPTARPSYQKRMMDMEVV